MHETTLVLTTHNRPHFVEQQVAFLTKQMKDNNITNINVLVLDSSVEGEKKEHSKKICEEAGFSYHSYPSDMNVYDKWYKGLSLVKTYTVTLLDHEDVINLNCLNEIVDFLNENKKYSCGTGIIPMAVPFNGFSIWRASDPHTINNHKDPFERILSLNVINSAYWVDAVHVTSVVTKIFEFFNGRHDISESTTLDLEVVLPAAILAAGKYKVFDKFFLGKMSLEERRYEEYGYTLPTQRYFFGRDPKYGTGLTDRMDFQKKILKHFLPDDIEEKYLEDALNIVISHLFVDRIGMYLGNFKFREQILKTDITIVQ